VSTAMPPTVSATRRAAAASMSATTIAFAPSAANRRHSARPIPFPPPVTTMILSVRCMWPPGPPRERSLRGRALGFHPRLQRRDILCDRARRGEQDEGEDRREDRDDVHRRVEALGAERFERTQIESF